MIVVTGDLIALYKRRAARLRAEACRSTWRSLWVGLADGRRAPWLLKVLRRLDRIGTHRTIA